MLKVLVAEDEPWIRAAIVEMIEGFGHDIKVVGDATNGIEAWHMIQQLWPTVLITDIMMPEMDGLELVRNISENKIPIGVIIISGYENFQYAQRAISYGVNKYLLKPVNREELQDALFEVMGKLTEVEKMNHYLMKIQTRLPTPGLKRAGLMWTLAQETKKWWIRSATCRGGMRPTVSTAPSSRVRMTA